MVRESDEFGLLAGPLSRPINSCILALGDWIDLGTRSSGPFIWLLTIIDDFNRCGGFLEEKQSPFCSGDIHFRAPIPAYRSSADKQIS
jgi:hypothetical protein